MSRFWRGRRSSGVLFVVPPATRAPFISLQYPPEGLVYPLTATPHLLRATPHPLKAMAHPLKAMPYPLKAMPHPLKGLARPMERFAAERPAKRLFSQVLTLLPGFEPKLLRAQVRPRWN